MYNCGKLFQTVLIYADSNNSKEIKGFDYFPAIRLVIFAAIFRCDFLLMDVNE
jgi:hypothetical protein